MSDITQELLQAATSMLDNSYAPYSNFNVGSALKTKSGHLFAGCNIENGSFGMTLCAETSAIAQMVSTLGKQEIEHILVLSSAKIPTTPCGGCLQRITEFCQPDTHLHLAHGKKFEIITSYRLKDFMPLSFNLVTEDKRQG